MRITILGNNSALPAHDRHPSAQIVEIKNELFLVDCGEGTQMRMNKFGIKRNKIHHIFISHLHGDHYFGLIGLINSLGLLNRSEPLHIYGPEKLFAIITLQLEACNSVMPYQLHFHPISDSGESSTLIDTDTYSIRCFPVDHRVPTHGFVFTEKQGLRKLLLDACQAYEIPTTFYKKIKEGADFLRSDGVLVKNEWVTEDGKGPKSYAYCADTKFTLSFVNEIKNADCIYHESTYLDIDQELATLRFHSTAKQAALLASEANVGKLLLGHYSTRYRSIIEFEEEAQISFPNSIATAEGMSIEL